MAPWPEWSPVLHETRPSNLLRLVRGPPQLFVPVHGVDVDDAEVVLRGRIREPRDR